MGVSVDTASKSTKKPVDAELNLIPFIDLLVCCICFLLITAVWVQMAKIPISQQGQRAGGEVTPAPRPPSVAVLVGDEGYTITVGGERLSIPKQGEVYDTEALGQQLVRIRPRLPDTVQLTVAAEDQIKYRHLVRTMDIALRSHFPSIHVADSSSARL